MNFLLSLSNLMLDAADVAAEVKKILGDWVGPLFIALSGIAGVYIIILSVQYIKAESDSKRAEAKSRIVNCTIGFFSLLLIGVLCAVLPWDKVAEVFGYAASGN